MLHLSTIIIKLFIKKPLSQYSNPRECWQSLIDFRFSLIYGGFVYMCMFDYQEKRYLLNDLVFFSESIQVGNRNVKKIITLQTQHREYPHVPHLTRIPNLQLIKKEFSVKPKSPLEI